MSKTPKHINELYDTHADAIFRFLVWQSNDEVLAEDLTSEVFFRAWKHRAKLEIVEEQQAWLYRTARNLLVDYWRRKKAVALDDIAEPLSDENVHESVIKQEQAELLQKHLSNLPAGMRTILVLRFFSRLPVETVAQIVDKSPQNVRVIQYRALKQLKKYYEHE